MRHRYYSNIINGTHLKTQKSKENSESPQFMAWPANVTAKLEEVAVMWN